MLVLMLGQVAVGPFVADISKMFSDSYVQGSTCFMYVDFVTPEAL